ncbi:MAG: glycosyltransferase, partial [Anaerolineae bacterium]|nr:glycosyltransferase [Anaerolineae bacterium]
MRVAMVTTHPPSQGTLNEYAYHFVRFLRGKPEVSEIILLVDEIPPGQYYDFSSFHLNGSSSPNNQYSQSTSPYSAPIQAIPCWRFGAWNNALRILRAVRRTKPDVVLFNIQFASFGRGKVPATLGLLAPVLVKKAGFPVVVLLHNIMETVDLKSAGFAANPLLETLIRTFGNIITRLLLNADLVALTIPKYVEILTEKYNASNVILAPHGSFDEVTTTPSFELPPGPIQIMTFGKFGTYKKVETLIEAVQMLRSGQRPPLELVIAGSDSPNTPGYLDGVRQQFADVPGLRFTGYVAEEEVPRIFGDAAVVVFPYTSTTGSSGVLHQAGDYAKAAVLPRLGDFAELIAEEGYTGEFFEPENAGSLAEAIASIIDDPDHRREIGMQNFFASRG